MLKLKKTETFKMPVEIQLPDGARGTLTFNVKYKSKADLKRMGDEEFTDEQYIAEILVGAPEGLGDENGNAITGDEALREFNDGVYSAFLQNAFLQEFFARFGEARVKNSKSSRLR
ncbi:phage tail assembly chaperone [Luteimonas sp. FXH3W]|uniref:Phage tail assembly chaperone n=1 Tax=Aquilutibacter rugosus TaxID=3115820 RepID=A0ABU7UW45_9GAMM